MPPIPTPTPTAAPTPWEVYQAAMNRYNQAAPTPIPTINPNWTPPKLSGPPGAGAPSGPGAGALLGSGLGAYGAYNLLGGGGAATLTGAQALTGGGLNAASMVPGLSGLSGGAAAGTGTSIGLGGLGSAGNVASTGLSGLGSAGSAAAPAGVLTGASPLLYWGAPLAGLAAFSAMAPKISDIGRKAGKKVGEALGLAGKHTIKIPYNPKLAAKSFTINRQLPGLSGLNEGLQTSVLDKFRAAGALKDQSSSIADPVLSQSQLDNSSKIGIGAAYLTDLEKRKLASKYGKWWNPRTIKPGDLAEILSPVGRNSKGIERLNAFNDALKTYDDAVFNQRVAQAVQQNTEPKVEVTKKK